MEDNVNPFSTRFIKPGAVTFKSLNSSLLQQLIQLLEENDWMGEIVGPHGSGKSTLIESLVPKIEKKIRQETIHANEDHRTFFQSIKSWLCPTHSNWLLIIDGFEQLSPDQQESVKTLCVKNQIGLLVSTHRPTGLPLLFESQTDRECFHQVVNDLMANRPIKISEEEIDYAFEKYLPNLREALFSLYDVYELKRRNQN